MAKLSLKAPPPPAALQAIARASGTGAPPPPGKLTAPPPAPEKKTRKLTRLEMARVRMAAVRKLPRKTASEKEKYRYAKALAAIKFDWVQRQEGKNQRAAWRAVDLALCRQHHPRFFDLDRPIALAVDAHKELAPLIGYKRAQRLLVWWTIQPAYVAVIAAGGDRYRLDGSVAGEISAMQQGIARGVLANKTVAQPKEEAA